MSTLSFITSSCIRRRLPSGRGGCIGSTVSSQQLSPTLRRGVNGDRQNRFCQTSLATNTNLFSSITSLLFKSTSIYLSSITNSVQRDTNTLKRLKQLSTQAAASIDAESTITQPSIIQSPDGRQFFAFELPKFQRKLKPYIVKRRLARMKTFFGKQKNIRHSPWRMNLVCQFAAGQTLSDAIQQLDFCRKSKAPLVKKVLIRTANTADMKYGLQQSQLEVAECFATKGTPMKRIRIMGRGRAGRMEHKHSHFRVVLREIDFKLRIYQAPTLGQKKRWFVRQQQAEVDYAKKKAERDEVVRLEKETEAFRNKEASKK